MTFDPKSKSDKARLYPVLKALAGFDPRKTPEIIMDDAVGYPIPHGKDYTRNMRRGEINSTVAQIVHRWIEKHHFKLAHEISPEIFPDTPARRWRKILDDRATTESLSLLLVKSELGVVQRESQLERVQQVIKLGQRFCFELDSGAEGHALALQGRGDHWHVIEMGQDGDAVTGIQYGMNRLPRLANGKLDLIWEDSDEGITDFVLITTVTNRIPLDIDRLIRWVAENGCNIHWATVRFSQ